MDPESDVAVRTRATLAERLKRDPAQVRFEDDLRIDLGLDSLDMIELLFKIEDVFNLQIPNEDLSQIATVGDVVAYIERRLAASPAMPAAAPPAAPLAGPPAAPPAAPIAAPIATPIVAPRRVAAYKPPAAGKRAAARRPAAAKAVKPAKHAAAKRPAAAKAVKPAKKSAAPMKKPPAAKKKPRRR